MEKPTGTVEHLDRQPCEVVRKKRKVIDVGESDDDSDEDGACGNSDESVHEDSGTEDEDCEQLTRQYAVYTPSPKKNKGSVPAPKKQKAAKPLYKAQGHFITYPQTPEELSKDDVMSGLQAILEAKSCSNRLEGIVVAEERHEDGGKHFHCFVKLKAPALYVYPTTFDLEFQGDVIHGNYQSCKSLKGCVDYVSKGGDFITYGDIDVNAWIRAQKSKKAITGEKIIKNGVYSAIAEHPELIHDYAKLCDNYNAYMSDLRAQEFDPEIPEKWHDWQGELINQISKKPPQRGPESRKIIWIVDYEGGKGKTTLGRFLIKNHDAITVNGKQADIFHAYKGQPICIFDLPRQKDTSAMDYIYNTMEKIKDGVYMSGKYDSSMRLGRMPWVLVFSNWDPDQSLLSADRWDVRVV